MRKIKSAADVERVRKRNNIILGVFMIGVLVLSYAGFAVMSSDQESSSDGVSEKGIDFVWDSGYWKIIMNEVVFGFQNLPSEVEGVEVNLSVTLSQYVSQPIYFVDAGEGKNEVLINLGNYVLRYQDACLNSSSCEGNFPVKSCEDSNMIIFEDGNETEVYSEGNCVFIVGDEIRGSDAFLYKLFGIA